jgi:hypothetical protein
MDLLLQTPWTQGLGLALGAYTQASDAYAFDAMVNSVAVWAVLIAAGLVLLEWVLARRATS